jgi:hypothetical protein
MKIGRAWLPWLALAIAAGSGAIRAVAPSSRREQSPAMQQTWKMHDLNRPQPRVIDPGAPGTQERPGAPPSDAVVLFNGKDMSEWRSQSGGPAGWRVADGTLETVKGAGLIFSRKEFGDCQLHVEWATPAPAVGDGQGRGNSGIFLMTKYEIQVLDSYQNKTYADGSAAAVYGQFPPLVNASKPPGQWQTYDIVFHAPRFDERGTVLRPARFTVLHNGVVVQDHVEVTGPTDNKIRLPYQTHAAKMPISLQDHGNPVRFRNIWVRELPEPIPPSMP